MSVQIALTGLLIVVAMHVIMPAADLTVPRPVALMFVGLYFGAWVAIFVGSLLWLWK